MGLPPYYIIATYRDIRRIWKRKICVRGQYIRGCLIPKMDLCKFWNIFPCFFFARLNAFIMRLLSCLYENTFFDRIFCSKRWQNTNHVDKVFASPFPRTGSATEKTDAAVAAEVSASLWMERLYLFHIYPSIFGRETGLSISEQIVLLNFAY